MIDDHRGMRSRQSSGSSRRSGSRPGWWLSTSRSSAGGEPATFDDPRPLLGAREIDQAQATVQIRPVGRRVAGRSATPVAIVPRYAEAHALSLGCLDEFGAIIDLDKSGHRPKPPPGGLLGTWRLPGKSRTVPVKPDAEVARPSRSPR